MVSVAVIALVTIAYVITTEAVNSEVDAALEREALAYSAAVRGAPSGDSLADATRRYLTARTVSGTGRDVVLLVALNSGRTIANSTVRIEDAPENRLATRPPSRPTYSQVSLRGVDYRLLSAPVRSKGQVVGVFQAAIGVNALAPTRQRIAATLTAAGMLALAIVLPLAYWATRRALRPLRLMASDAEAISHATPGKRIAYSGPRDELGSLAESLNGMVERLEAAFEDQRRFVADASHELRTPVAVVRGNTELLRSGVLDQEGEAASLEAIEDEALRMTRLLDDMLSLARFDNMRKTMLQPLLANTLLEEVAARTRALGDRKISLDAGCDAWIEGDPDLLDQALANIARNAVASTEPGGRIDFVCQVRDGRVCLTVTDDGPGIAPEDLDRVFDRFCRASSFRPEAESGGAGLGLAITRQIIELHGGTVGADNVEPHGARFTIELPLLDGAGDAKDPRATASARDEDGPTGRS